MKRCKFCGSMPKTGQFGKIYEVYCPEMDSRKCKAPPSVEAPTLTQAVKEWDVRFGAGNR